MLIQSILSMSLPRTADVIQPGSEFMFPFVGIALACLAIGFYYSNRRTQWLQHSAVADGVVVDVFKKYNRDDKMGNYPLHFPRVQFSVGNHHFEAQGEAAVDAPVQIGEHMKVRYNVENPEEATLGVNKIPGTNPKVFFILGAVFTVVGVLFAL
ncbi:DUF3592 domain-containing protein [Siphonobacter aquaeclarae]|jgi:hypothetical protein|uniref:DUF3592 domain-containing protein n=1 Tax=Siphonobacter aquaeclarae TaxID=563176 RepID=A0A1G9R1B0_9BACT|nr:DUF3592 domain-containing protein [Siphonobacter aquaeclarae]MBO9640297.1 hypothetical protein [Siphonobacter aquaeclarae]SDM17076.1 hypothetical protein SAMN04488090_2690 [Siphonobacter aquaeclarae]